MTVETLQSNYKQLMEKMKEFFVFTSAESIIHWDMETMMPPKAVMLRSEQLALLSRIAHKMITDPAIGRLLEEIQKNPNYEELDAIQKRNVYLINKHYNEQTKLPEELVAAIAKQRAITVDSWKKAKAAKKFSMFQSELEKLTELEKNAAEILMEVKETKTPYDALIDIYEPKMTAENITKVFSELRSGLVSILKKCENSPRQPDTALLKRKVPINIQREISRTIAEFVGYDISSKNAGGRIDETEHPFTIGYFNDVRITTHYYEDNFTSSIFSVLHEAGHALYEQNINSEWIYQPIGTACSSGFHESQSRFIENIVGRSYEFWHYFLPKIKTLTGNLLSDVNYESFIHAINQVKPSKIRVEADEVTYCLHIIIRFNIEKDLFADKIIVKELSEIWNQSYKEHLGIEIENDSEGVMQDTHWASGLYGYFPSYALGNIYSGQILAAMEKELPEWRMQLKKGEFSKIKQWLVENVHHHGNLYDPEDLLKRITGKGLNAKPYITYLKNKFSQLYGF